MQKAEKNKEKVLKDQLTRLRSKLLAPVEQVQERQALIAKAEFRETINMIKESSQRDLIERERMKELKLR